VSDGRALQDDDASVLDDVLALLLSHAALLTDKSTGNQVDLRHSCPSATADINPRASQY
jgi:hypothetical protein